MIDALAFLPLNIIEDGVIYLRGVMPPAAAPLLDYFVQTYVTGNTTVGGVARRQKPVFQPTSWNVFDVTRDGGDRTKISPRDGT